MPLRTVRVQGGPLVLREWGAEGVPLVFWHSLGAGGNGAFLGIVAAPLVAAGIRPIALDAPGYGRSPGRERDDYAIDRLAALLWDTVAAAGVDRPILAGHSWGGTVVATAAAQRPDDVRALVLLDSGHVDYADWPGAEPEATYEQLLDRTRADTVSSWDELIAELADANLGTPESLPAWREAVTDGPDGFGLRATPEARAAASYALVRARASDAWPAIAAARIPTLLLLATEPPELGEANSAAAARFSAAVPHARVDAIPGVRHNVLVDLGERAGTIVAKWLAAEGVV